VTRQCWWLPEGRSDLHRCDQLQATASASSSSFTTPMADGTALGHGNTILPNARVLRCVHVLDSQSLSSDLLEMA
jgi:hypothetical protein